MEVKFDGQPHLGYCDKHLNLKGFLIGIGIASKDVSTKWVSSSVESALISVSTTIGMNNVREMVFSYNTRLAVQSKERVESAS